MTADNWFKFYDSLPNDEHPNWEGKRQILIHTDNIHPGWIEKKPENTEFYLDRGKDTLLINIGESWTYGENVPGVAAGLEKYNLASQLKHCYGPKLALCLDSDIHQYATPGNCNLYMFQELERILEQRSGQYEKIVICMLMTEPAREKNGGVDYDNHPLNELYKLDVDIDFDQWLIRYDEIFFEIFEKLCKKYNAEGILFKNFCKINTEQRYDFLMIENSWIKQAGIYCNKKLDMPRFWNTAWLENIMEEYKGKIRFDMDTISKDLDAIEESMKFIEYNRYNHHHPTPLGHTIWAHYIADKYYGSK